MLLIHLSFKHCLNNGTLSLLSIAVSRHLRVMSVRASMQAIAEMSKDILYNEVLKSAMELIQSPKISSHCFRWRTAPSSKITLSVFPCILHTKKIMFIECSFFLFWASESKNIKTIDMRFESDCYHFFHRSMHWYWNWILPVRQSQDEELKRGWLEQQVLVFLANVRETGNFGRPRLDDVHRRRYKVIKHLRRFIIASLAFCARHFILQKKIQRSIK